MPGPLRATAAEGNIRDIHCWVRLQDGAHDRLLDATWPSGMAAYGFPVNDDWNGRGDTRPAVADGVVRDTAEDVVPRKEALLAEFSREETEARRVFLKRLSAWLDGFTGERQGRRSDMSTKKVFVGVDAGTTGCTVMIFDEAGRAVGHGYQEYDCISPQSGWIEQDVDAVWNGICGASRKAVAEADLPREAYHSLGVSSQRGTFVPLDGDMKPLMNSLVWNCGRALKCEEAIAAVFPGEGEHQAHTGMQVSPLWTAAKIIWLREHRPEIFDKAKWFANGQEYFLHRMGAEDWSTDPASLTLSGMMDVAALDWSDRILDVCGVGRDRFRPWRSRRAGRAPCRGRPPRKRACRRA